MTRPSSTDPNAAGPSRDHEAGTRVSYMEQVCQAPGPRQPSSGSAPRDGMDPRVKLVLAIVALASGYAVYLHSSSARARSEYMQVFDAPPAPASPDDAELRAELQRQEHQMLLAEREQQALAESLRPLYMKPPPPPAAPSAPMMTRKEWKAVIARETKHSEALRHQAEQGKDRRFYLAKGDWYWKYSRNYNTNMQNPKLPQCFQNATARAADFWAPIEGSFRHDKVLPIYDQNHLNTPKALCFTGSKKQTRGWKTQACSAAVWEHQIKARWSSASCAMKPLYEDMLLALLRGHRVWFFGDQNTESIYKTLACTMAPHRKGAGKLAQGTITGMTPVYQSFGFQQDTALHYVYVGPYQAKPSDGPAGSQADMGLGAELRSRYGIDTAAQENLDRQHELADALQENMDNFLPTDVIVLNIGNDFKEPRRMQASLLKFLRVYQDNAERMPVVIWQESTAQHHVGFKGGDRNGERLVQREADPLGLVEDVINNAPCRFYCWPGGMPTYMAEALVTLLDSEPLQVSDY
eukprot:jgi/Tetstr1/465608/TSEL_010254.t1